MGLRLRLPGFSARFVQRLIHGTARWTRPLTIGVRTMIFDGENQVFLVKHSYVPGWHLPGGAVEPGETLFDAMLRETREECGIEVTGQPALHGIFFNSGASRRDHVVVYVVRAFRQGQQRPPDWEIVEAGFFPVHALPDGTTAATRRRLREVLDGSAAASEW